MSVFGGHFLVLFQCVMTVSWNQPQPGCWNWLYYILIHSCKYTTFQIRTVFNNVLFSSEVHNPLHAHLLALSHICVLRSEFGHVQLLTTVALCLTHRTNTVTLTKVSPKHGSLAFLFLISFPITTISDTVAKGQPREGGQYFTREHRWNTELCWANMAQYILSYFQNCFPVMICGTYSIQRHQPMTAVTLKIT